VSVFDSVLKHLVLKGLRFFSFVSGFILSCMGSLVCREHVLWQFSASLPVSSYSLWGRCKFSALLLFLRCRQIR